jgi:tRNA modification GTPase
MAEAGEFTLRAFMNGRIDLSQAEAVADLIASNSAAAHDIAIKQIRGGFAHQIRDLRAQLVNFASLIELELDFSEEDVEFVQRNDLVKIIHRIQAVLIPLIDSFKYGNVIKNGVPVAIIGKPNAGKSTLLNALLNEERAIVSHIAGTTRDTIEEVLNIDGIAFRFIDTAGIRETSDEIEGIGVEKALEKIKDASIVLHIIDVDTYDVSDSLAGQIKSINPDAYIIGLLNKIDVSEPNGIPTIGDIDIAISARERRNIPDVKAALLNAVKKDISGEQTIVANIRHYEALRNAYQSLASVLIGIDASITTDLIALELKRALTYLGEISGEVTNDEILGNIFSKFCIGK